MTVERVGHAAKEEHLRLTNGTVEVLLATSFGPRILRYGFVGDDNLLGAGSPTTTCGISRWHPGRSRS